MESKGGNDGTTVVISSGSNSKTASTAPSEPSTEREERAWKAYFAQTDAPLTTTLLTQVNGEDSNMASTLGFLYDYYGVTEDSGQGPSSPGGTQVSSSSSPQGNNHGNNCDSEPNSPTHSEPSLSYLHSVHQIKNQQSTATKTTSTSADSAVCKSEVPREKTCQGIAVVHQVKGQSRIDMMMTIDDDDDGYDNDDDNNVDDNDGDDNIDDNDDDNDDVDDNNDDDDDDDNDDVDDDDDNNDVDDDGYDNDDDDDNNVDDNDGDDNIDDNDDDNDDVDDDDDNNDDDVDDDDNDGDDNIDDNDDDNDDAYNFGPYNAAFKATPTVFSAQDKYTYVLEAPTSIVQRRGDDTLTYLNKGQFYAIDFEGNVDPPSSESDVLRVKTVVHLVFRDEKDPRTELEHWHYWHSQQPNPQQRAFDVDRKSCQNIDENIDDLSYNAAGFVWSPHVNAKIVIRINCLSTDFSPQKGVKGIPLHLQIDTYEDPDSPDAEPIHRAFCQIKVFRDKGAERKNKDESKSAERRMQKWMKQNPIGADPTMISPTHLFHPPSKFTQLLSTTPLGPKPVLFTPYMGSSSGNLLASADQVIQTSSLLSAIRDREHKRTIQTALAVAKEEFADLEVVPRMKVQRVHRPDRPAVTIYVKKDEEKVYNALMLKQLTIKELVNQVSDKYNVPPDMIKSVYKKTKKGILVNMDDRMIELFVDEDDFIINLDFDNQLGHFELTLRY
ncbi:hypothetical protein QZH41_018886 [Actinostola sp. cb2023]|nr:hypothetical protein QZH41_018886 [Actinostola sp. cb2023]